MTLRSDIVLEWANGEYLFALRVSEIETLEAESINPSTNKPGIGIGAIWMRLMRGDWYISDIHNVIRLGLIGGGMGAVEAKRMVKNYAEGVPISTMNPSTTLPNCPLVVAQAILSAVFVGVEDKKTVGNSDQGE